MPTSLSKLKNYISNIPFIKPFVSYFNSVIYKLKSKNLLIGYNNELCNVKFGVNNALGDHISLAHINIGDYSYISFNTKIQHTSIGKFCSIGPSCLIGLGKHPVNDFISTHPMFFSNRKQNGMSLVSENLFEEFKEITIGNDVWIGANVTILDGVEIGDGSIIAAGSVVTKNVAAYEIVGGIPAKHIRYRFPEETIEKLQKIKWWNWSESKLISNKELFLNPESFSLKFEKEAIN